MAVKNAVSTSTISTALTCTNVYLYCFCYNRENTKTKKKANNILVLSQNPEESSQVSTDHRTTDIDHTGTPKDLLINSPNHHSPVFTHPHYLLLQVTIIQTATISDWFHTMYVSFSIFLQQMQLKDYISFVSYRISISS